MPVFPSDNSLDEEYKKRLKEIGVAMGELTEDEDVGELTEEEEMEMKRSVLFPVTRTYVTGMIRAMIDNSAQNYEFSEEELDKLWVGSCGSGEFAKRSGLTSEEGEITLKAAEETFLEDLFDEPVTVSVRKKLYTISRTEKGLYVVLQS